MDCLVKPGNDGSDGLRGAATWRRRNRWPEF